MEQLNPSEGPECCKQCGNKLLGALVKCTHNGCNTWYCNNYEKNQNISHIVRHMKTQKHNRVELHPTIQSSHRAFICTKCNTRNIFILGQLPNSETVCRDCMLSKYPISMYEWQPFIQEDRFRHDIVLSKEVELDTSNQAVGQPDARDMNIITEAPRVFNTKSEYYRFYSNLLNEEMREELTIKKVREEKGVSIKFEQFSYICRVEVGNHAQFSVGDIFEVRNNSKNTQAEGKVRKFESGEIHLEFSKKSYKKLLRDHRKPVYTIQLKPNTRRTRKIVLKVQNDLSWYTMSYGGSFDIEKYALGQMLRSGIILIIKNQISNFEDKIMINQYKNGRVQFTCSILAEDGESSLKSLYDVRLHCSSVVYSRMNKALYDFTRRNRVYSFTKLLIGDRGNTPPEGEAVRASDNISNNAIIGDLETITDFLHTGFAERNPEGEANFFAIDDSISNNDIKEAFNRFTTRTDLKILFINERIAEGVLRGLIDSYQEVIPAIMKIPSYNRLKLPPACPELNESQHLAVYKALGSEFLLIQGPPGTGKTTTASVIILNLFKLYGKVLVAAPSNNAADEIASRLIGTSLRITRLYSFAKEEIGIMRYEDISFHKKLEELLERLASIENPTKDIIEQINNPVKTLLNETDVLVCTCAGAYDERISMFYPESVLIDESTQAKEPECLMPMLKGAKKIIMIGDHRQLAPICFSRKAHNGGLSLSLFERLVRNEIEPHILDTQYRMNPDISYYSNHLFYKGIIKDATVQRGVIEPWRSVKSSMFFYDVPGKEEASASSTSYINRQEARIILEILQFISNQLVPLDRIQVVAFYEGQREYLEQYLNSILGTDSIQVYNVDGCQGREYDYVVLSCSRANEKGKVGFLHYPGRLNVSITRARYGNIIVGNAKALAQGGIWGQLLGLLKSRKLVLSGDVGELKPSEF